MNKFRVTGNFKVTGTPWSHTARITEVPLYYILYSDTIWSKPPDPHPGSYLMDGAGPYTELNDDCLHCLFEEWMTGVPGKSNFLNCHLHDEVKSVSSCSLYALDCI